MSDWRHAIARRLEPLRLPPTREAEVVEELSQHLDDRYRELRSAGASEAAARREALAELDDADLVRELTGIEARAVEPLSLGSGPSAGFLDSVWQDLRFGARLLVKDRAASFRLIAIGAALGVTCAWAIGLAMRSILFGVGAAEPATYAAVLGLVGLCGALATYLPAHRAIAIDPMAVLKRE